MAFLAEVRALVGFTPPTVEAAVHYGTYSFESFGSTSARSK